VLEVKRKRGVVGTKRFFPLNSFAYGPDFSFEAIRRATCAAIGDPVVAELVNASRPALANRYRRRYLVSADGRFRMTIDTAVRFERVHGEPPRGPFTCFEERDLVVLELKYDATHDGGAAAILGRLPYRVTRFSKYLSGIARLGGFEL